MSTILARVFAIYFVTVGSALILNPQRFKDLYSSMMDDEGWIVYGGLLALIVGSGIVSVHNNWAMDWPLVITLLGWLSVVKGFALLTFPQSIATFRPMGNLPKNLFRGMGVLSLLSGLFFVCKGWY